MDKPFSLSVKVLIRDDEGRYLFLKRSSLSKANAGQWDLPGGKVDPGETFQKALEREVKEETGLEIALEHVAGAFDRELPDKKIAYLFMEGRLLSGQVVLSREHDDFVWLACRDLPRIELVKHFMPLIRDFSRRRSESYYSGD